ncbi:hypothetical protein ILUMI_17016 [Ignelater luminosus]|uniref:Reverse transcriptase domain-containing protein n=1 Tax=Ignelater luminosus TaxID=2038154 RepID=A0A8K0CPW4_IGNLU|nr:hypothetical protein ILUMI_17016 [Ignelater luminosus]
MGSNEPLNLTTEEIACENHFRKNTIRDDSGRFIVKLPIKNDKLDIGDTRETALKRFFSLERNLRKDPQKKRKYLKFISEYRELNHMELMTQLPSDSQSVYLSHHAVVNENSTTSRLRVVFDASAKSSNNRSLNDNLMSGPVIQQDLFSIISRFRTFQYVLTRDITKMYHQIRVNYEDANYQLIFWRDSSDKPVQTYRLLTLTYGTKPASFIVTRCLEE